MHRAGEADWAVGLGHARNTSYQERSYPAEGEVVVGPIVEEEVRGKPGGKNRTAVLCGNRLARRSGSELVKEDGVADEHECSLQEHGWVGGKIKY